jgi:NADH-ubiquinone oxidoreductase chain 3
MKTIIFFFLFVPILSAILLGVNFLLASHNPYQEKNSVFECGFHSFTGQNRTQFNISFFMFSILFMLFDVEIVLCFPYSVSSYLNDLYGLSIMMVFFVLLTLGFVFELGKNALTIDSRQTLEFKKNEVSSLELFTDTSSNLKSSNTGKKDRDEFTQLEEDRKLFVEGILHCNKNSARNNTSILDLMDRIVLRKKDSLCEFIVLSPVGSEYRTGE